MRKRLAQASPDHLRDHIRNRRLGDRPRALVATIANDRDAVGDGEDLLQAVRDVDDGQPFVAQAAQQREEPFRLGGAEGRVRLVHDDDLGLLLQRPRDLDELLFRDGETTHFRVGIEIDAHLGQDAPRRRHHLALVEQSRAAGRLAVGKDIGRHRQVGKEIQLLEDDADPELPGLQADRR